MLQELPTLAIQLHLHRLTWAFPVAFCYAGKVYNCPPMQVRK